MVYRETPLGEFKIINLPPVSLVRQLHRWIERIECGWIYDSRTRDTRSNCTEAQISCAHNSLPSRNVIAVRRQDLDHAPSLMLWQHLNTPASCYAALYCMCCTQADSCQSDGNQPTALRPLHLPAIKLNLNVGPWRRSPDLVIETTLKLPSSALCA